MKPSLYMETTVPSYYTAKTSRDIIVLAHQAITKEWWETCLVHYNIFVSEVVIQEISLGDTNAVKERMKAISAFHVLEITPECEKLAEIYLLKIPIIKKAFRDALHLAVASIHGMDYLITWNCTHIARGEVKKYLEQVNASEGIAAPTICTPEELLGG